jgi:hypothetical protein
MKRQVPGYTAPGIPLSVQRNIVIVNYLSNDLRNRPKDVESSSSRSIRVLKPHAAWLVAEWVTISESLVPIVFALFAWDGKVE